MLLSTACDASAAQDAAVLFRNDAHRDDHAPTLHDHLSHLRKFAVRQHIGRNESVFEQGDAARAVYKILSGTVRLCRHMQDGRRHIAGFEHAGDLFGVTGALEHAFTAEAITSVTLIAYPRAAFDRLAEQDPRFRANVLAYMSERLEVLGDQNLVLGCHNAKERVASFVLKLARRTGSEPGERLDLAMGRQDIADHLGLTIETVCRAISALKSGGLVAVPNAHQLILNDMAGLRRMAEGTA
jgi:CRP-like cAMP-binding protein